MLAGNDKNERIDDNIDRGDEVLRARDVIPSINKFGKDSEAADVPVFDLGEQILSEQRKFASVRRKGPGKKAQEQENSPEIEVPGDFTECPSVELSDDDRIIAAIVAEDIKRLVESS